MKKLLTIIFLTSLSISTNAQDSLNFTKLSTWTSPNATRYNDCWGYTDSLGNEYATLGSNWGTHFINITDPVNPIEVNSFIGENSNVTWRDFKVSGNYAYGVADNFGNSLQIFDLSNLPTSVTKVYDEDSLSESSHNSFIDNERLYLAINRKNGSTFSLEVIDIQNPVNPVFLGSVSGITYFGNSGVHDIYVKDNIAYCSAEYSGQFILDLTDVNNPIQLGQKTTYSQQGYNHSSWVNDDDNIMVMADEVPNGLALKILDVSDLNSITELTTFQSNTGATPHNPYIKGNEVYISYYHDGMRVFDISDPSNPIQTGFYDTYPNNGTSYPSGYEGNWGVYPFFNSRNVIASDITYGLFVLGKVNDVYTTDDDIVVCAEETNINIPFDIKGTFNPGNAFFLELSDSNGTFKTPTTLALINGTTSGTFNALIPSDIARGNEYRVRVKSNNPAITEGEYQKIYFSDKSNISIDLDDTICQGESITIKDSTFNTTGTYTINSASTCDTTYNLNLIVNEIQLPTITINNEILETISGFTYQWYFNGQLIMNETNQSMTPVLEGNYSVTISNGECSRSSSNYFYQDGINTLFSKSDSKIKIYPNPSKGVVNIQNDENIKIDIEILNSLGQIVISKSISKNVQIQLKKGLYIVKISSSKNSYSEKVIVE